MKILLSFFVFVNVLLHVNASSVIWNCFEQKYGAYGYSGTTIEFLSYNDDSLPSFFMPAVLIESAIIGSEVKLSGSNGVANMAFQGIWLEKDYGDLVDFSTMSGRSDYFSATAAYAVSGSDATTPINTRQGETIYLAVMQDYWGPEYSQGKYFGWIELYIESSGDVTLQQSAFAIDGSPLIVGDRPGNIPEPVSGVLMLVGAGVLALKRRERRLS